MYGKIMVVGTALAIVGGIGYSQAAENTAPTKELQTINVCVHKKTKVMKFKARCTSAENKVSMTMQSTTNITNAPVTEKVVERVVETKEVVTTLPVGMKFVSGNSTCPAGTVPTKPSDPTARDEGLRLDKEMRYAKGASEYVQEYLVICEVK